jgi:hypothetical protein
MERALAYLLGLVAVAACVAVGCRSEPTELQPAPAGEVGGGEVPPPGAERTVQEAGVRLTAEADGWLGWDAIQRKVTPLRVRLDNDGDKPVLLQYEAFVVTSERGERYAVVPPFEMDQDVETYVAVDRYGPITEPYWDYDLFSVAPYYARTYPGFAVYDTYAWDAGYYGPYANYWVDVDLPTREMIYRVLPEGVVEPGGFVEGVLFFEHVPEDARGLTLRAVLKNPDTDQVFARMEMPLVLEEEEG